MSQPKPRQTHVTRLSLRPKEPSGPPEWIKLTESGYRLQYLPPFQRFRGVELPWEDDAELQECTDYIAKSSRSRKVVRLTAGQFGTPVDLYVKRYNFKNDLKRFLRLPRASRAKQEFETGWRLIEKGIRTPRPVWVAETSETLPRFSLLATESLPEAECVYERWTRLAGEQERKELLSALGRFLLMIHETGFYHDDFKARHVLSLPHAVASPYEFFVIDLLGCGFPYRLTRYKRAKNLYQIIRSFCPKNTDRGFTPEHRSILLEAYCGSSREISKWEQWIERVGRLKGRVL